MNLLLVLRDFDAQAFTALSPPLTWWTREQQHRPPTIFTLQELQESADVFAIELLDIQHSHRVLLGQDVVAGIEIHMNLHRVEVEHELRTTLLRLRHHLLLSPEDEEELRLVLAKSITSVLTLFRHSLIALGETPPHDRSKLLEHAGELFAFDPHPLKFILEIREHDQPVQGHIITDVRQLYYAYVSAIARVAHELDVREPKQKWRKQS